MLSSWFKGIGLKFISRKKLMIQKIVLIQHCYKHLSTHNKLFKLYFIVVRINLVIKQYYQNKASNIENKFEVLTSLEYEGKIRDKSFC